MTTKRTRRLLSSSLAIAALFVGCRTASTGTETADLEASGISGSLGNGPVRNAVVDVSGSAAKAVYDSMNSATIAERPTSKGFIKLYQGRLSVSCSYNGMPPGAMGMPGRITYDCSARVPLPSGALGFPAPAFMHITGAAAGDFSGAFTAQPRYVQAAHLYEQSFVSANGKLVCEKNRVSGQMPPGVQGMPTQNPFDYRCVVAGN